MSTDPTSVTDKYAPKDALTRYTPITDEDLLTAAELPCRVCGAPVNVARLGTISDRRRRVRLMSHQMAERDPALADHYQRQIDIILAKLRTLPMVECPYRTHDWTRPCEHCGTMYNPPRRDGRYCSGRCRVAAHRQHKTDQETP